MVKLVLEAEPHERPFEAQVKNIHSNSLGLNSGLATFYLCDLGLVTGFLCVSESIMSDILQDY